MGKVQKLSPEAVAALMAGADRVEVVTGPVTVTGDLNLGSSDDE